MPRLPSTTARALVRFLKRQGFLEVRQTGSHLTLRHPVSHASTTVPMHTGTDIGKGLLLRILKDAGIAPDVFHP